MLSYPWSPTTSDVGLTIEPLIWRPLRFAVCGEIATMSTGPTTHQSPFANWPTCSGCANCHVMPHCVIADALVGPLPPPPVGTSTTTPSLLATSLELPLVSSAYTDA